MPKGDTLHPGAGGPYRVSAAGSHPLIRFTASLISWIFHPLFITSYVMAFLIYVHPYAFAGMDPRTKGLRMIHILLDTALLPLFCVLLMWKLKLFLESVYLRSSRERIIPYILAMIFYWWSWNVFKNLQDSPPVSVHYLLGAFLAVCGAWMCNIWFKISMHAVAMGGLAVFFLLYSLEDPYGSGLYISLAFLVAGAVCTARFLVSDHYPMDIYAGLLVGMLSQLVAWLI